MITDSGTTRSIWMDAPARLDRAPLQADASADVAIIGAGMAGLTTAYLLSSQGQSVIVLDDGPMTGGETGRTTAHLSNAIDDRYVELERLHGPEGAALAADSHTAAIARIESIVQSERINCDFTRLDGYLFVPGDQPRDLIDRELAAAHRAGLTSVERVDRAPLSGVDTGPCLRFPAQAQFHPLLYLQALASAIEARGGRICTQTHASQIQGGDDARVTTSAGPVVRCRAIVVATNSPINDLVAIHTKQAPYRTYVIGARVPRGSLTPALYWDTAEPYHYVRLQPLDAQHDLLIVGGEDHKTGQAADPDDRFSRLEAWTRVHFPIAQDITFRWSGQVMEPIDGVAFIGANPLDKPNVFIATGDSGQGMTHGTIAGILLTDLILGRPNPWARLYDPSRKTLKSFRDFASENLNVARQYLDHLAPGEVSSPDQIPPGHGAIVRQGLKKLAVQRDDTGQLHTLSATCTHLGCVVRWNPLEKTWDCPCHGSRFKPTGQVINGPANTNLPPADA